MSGYNPPLDDINFCIRHLTDIDNILSLDPFEGMDVADLEQVLEEAGKFARDVIAPTNAIGDRKGVSLEGNTVRVPDEVAEVHAQYVANGWQSVAGNPEFDGMGLPSTVANAVSEMVQTGNLAYSLLPMLTSDAAPLHGLVAEILAADGTVDQTTMRPGKRAQRSPDSIAWRVTGSRFPSSSSTISTLAALAS